MAEEQGITYQKIETRWTHSTLNVWLEDNKGEHSVQVPEDLVKDLLPILELIVGGITKSKTHHILIDSPDALTFNWKDEHNKFQVIVSDVIGRSETYLTYHQIKRLFGID